ncbi:MAG TPA: carboxypeptidase regulatory-like domain-containing protein [Variovorax sp.]
MGVFQMRASYFSRSLLGSLTLIAAAATPWLAQAQTGAIPEMKSGGAGQYVCGGVGVDESTAMRAAMKDHPLSLLFARAGGAYLANVDVAVKDASGATALAMRTDGPICLVDLPAGRYTVEASTDGVTKSEAVTLGRGARTADFRW